MVKQNEEQQTLSDLAKPLNRGTQSIIVKTRVIAMNFKLEPPFIQMLQQTAQFSVLANEDPNSYIENFLEVYDLLKINGVSDDAIWLRAFPFSLKDQAKQWLQELLRGSITTWDEMVEAFLTRYFPPEKLAKL